MEVGLTSVRPKLLSVVHEACLRLCLSPCTTHSSGPLPGWLLSRTFPSHALSTWQPPIPIYLFPQGPAECLINMENLHENMDE